MLRETQELWNEAYVTGRKARFHRSFDCWLYEKFEDIPDYMMVEWERGRILLCSQFKGPDHINYLGKDPH